MDDLFEPAAPRRLGEVIETSTVRIWTECDELNELPGLGSVVETSTATGERILAIVSYGETAGVDSTRRAIRRGSDSVRDDEVYRQHPELTRVLRSTFESVPVAFLRDSTLHCVVPPVPPPLHYSVETSSDARLIQLTDRLAYLPMLARYAGEVAAEQIVIAHVREVYRRRGQDDDWLERAATEIGRLYSQQYDLLLPILDAIDPGNGIETSERALR